MSNNIPEEVMQSLAAIRLDGEINMMSRESVIGEMRSRAEAWDEADDYRTAAEWLDSNKDRYMDALITMGEQGG